MLIDMDDYSKIKGKNNNEFLKPSGSLKFKLKVLSWVAESQL